MSKPPAPMIVTKYSSRGSIYANEFGSEIVCEDIAQGVSVCVTCYCRCCLFSLLLLS
jgi:hypothetical protein